MRAAAACVCGLLVLVVAAERRRPVRIHLRQPGTDQELAEVSQNETNLSFRYQVRGQRRPSSNARKPAGDRRQSTTEATNVAPSSGGQGDGVQFTRQRQRPGQKQTVTAATEEEVTERSRPSGGRRTGQPRRQISPNSPGVGGQSVRPKKTVRKKKKMANPTLELEGVELISTGSGGPITRKLNDEEINKVLQEARQIVRGQRLVSHTLPKVRAQKKVKRKKSKKSKSTSKVEKTVTTTVSSKRGQHVDELFSKIMAKKQKAIDASSIGQHLTNKRLQQHGGRPSAEIDVLEREKEPIKGPTRIRTRGKLPSEVDVLERERGPVIETEKEPTRIQTRGMLPRKHPKNNEETTTPSIGQHLTNKRHRGRPSVEVDVLEREKEPVTVTSKRPTRIRTRGKFPRKHPKNIEETTTPRSIARFNSVRHRSRVLPKIDPRGRDQDKQNISSPSSTKIEPYIPSVQFSGIFSEKHSVVATTTTSTTTTTFTTTKTTSSSTFNLIEPEETLPHTESYPAKEVSTITLINFQQDKPHTQRGSIPRLQSKPPPPVTDSKTSHNRRPSDEKEETLVPGANGQLLPRRHSQRRRVQGKARPTGTPSTTPGKDIAKPRRRGRPVSSPGSGRTAKPEATAKNARPYQRGRHRVSSKAKERNNIASRPKSYQTKVYGLIQNPTLETGDEEASPSNDFSSYIDVAINHAEVTWSQDPFRQESLLSGDDNKPVFDIDFSKDPTKKTRPKSESTNKAAANLFDTRKEATNAIDKFYKGSFVFNNPAVSRPRIPSISSRKTEPVVITASPSEVSEVEIPITLFDPFTFYRNL